VRQHQGGRGDATAIARGNDVHHHPKIQVAVVEARNKTAGGFADNRKNANAVGGSGPARDGGLEAERRDHIIAQRQQRSDPSRRAP
jgi:hypothetical protein